MDFDKDHFPKYEITFDDKKKPFHQTELLSLIKQNQLKSLQNEMQSVYPIHGEWYVALKLLNWFQV